ncbi:MAG: phosphate ABC transporter substrate-binding protein PstS [Bacillaceae bacterium]|nr:phosphate ABC transporter substrate-binding protein PstS [Bacillaceae bacterium]
MAACGSSQGDQVLPGQMNNEGGNGAKAFNASGSSFIYPLFSKMFDEYNKLNPDVTINYQSTGSGTGIKQLIEGIVDFAASDAPMNDEDMAAAGSEVLHLPMTLGAVAVAYNLEGIESGQLNLTGDLVADIFAGKITKWNDPAIQEVNPDLDLPDESIAAVHRSDGSGTTYIFTDYLSTVNEEWKQNIGTGKAVDWPGGIGAKGNEGVAGQITNTPGSIGYIGLEYAVQNDIPVANIQNKEGEFITPSLESVSQAAAGAVEIVPEDLRFSMVDMPGEGSYPIAGATWALVYKEQQDMEKAKELVKLLEWANTEGQQYAEALLYAPLPAELQELNKKQLAKITVDGQKVLE